MEIIRKAFRSKLKPNIETEHLFRQYTGAQRFIWNHFLKMNLHRLDNKYKLMGHFEMCWWVTHLMKTTEEYGWLKNIPAQAIQNTLKHLARAFKDGFDKTQPNKRMPKYKSRNRTMGSYSQTTGVKIDGTKVWLPTIGWVRYFYSRDVVGKIKTCTVTKEPTGWFISIQTEIEKDTTPHPSTSEVGLDRGIKVFAALSNGKLHFSINTYKKHQDYLAKLQRKLTNKVRFSNNWRKLQRKIGQLHHKIANCRKDYLHKLSTILSKSHALIVLEDLKISNMVRSAKGTIDVPGKSVKAKSGLNRAILDQGWSMFAGFLKYKMEWLNGILMKVFPHYTSQKCPPCGHTSKDNRKTQADFVCVNCGFVENADVVGAINCLTAGQVLLAS